MRTLHVDLGREMRGGQWQVLALMKALGQDATLLAHRKGPLLRAAQNAGVRAVPFSPLELLSATRQCDLMHAHDSRAHQWLAVFTRPLIVSRRVAFPIAPSALNRWKYSRASHYIAVSRFVKGQLAAAGVPDRKVSVVYDGVDLPSRTSTGGRIVAVATGDSMKGSQLARDAAASGGFEVQFSKDLIHDLESADVFLYVSHSEGLGSAALLAMAYGVAVVASRIGGLIEVIEDGVTGYLTENRTEAIVDAVARARSQWRTLGANGRKRVEAQFTTAHMTGKTVEVYRKVLGE